MKRNVAAHPLWVACVVLLCWTVSTQGSAQIFEQRALLGDLASSLKTPEAIAHFMWRHFIFESDRNHFGREDYWQSPEELFLTRRGDCEDFALFAHELLKRNGIPSFLLSLYGKGLGHTVCIFKENGRYRAIDEVRLLRYGSPDLLKLFSEIYPFWQHAAVVDYSAITHQGKILKQFIKRRS